MSINLGGNTHLIHEARPNSCYDVPTGLPNPADVAVMVLKTPIVGGEVGKDWLSVWNPADHDGKTMKDEIFTLIGWGSSGPVGDGESDYNIFHRAENRVESIHDNMLVYVFDEQGEGVPRLEGIGNSGDSGGPALVWNATTEQWNIGGVKSNGACCDYGAENEYTRLGGIAY